MRTEDCFRKEHNTVEGEKREKEWSCDDPEVEEQEDDVLIISDIKYEKEVKKFALLDLFLPIIIISYHLGGEYILCDKIDETIFRK